MLLSRAVHNLPWGTLESEEVLVEVKEPLGKVSLIINITVMANIINMRVYVITVFLGRPCP